MKQAAPSLLVLATVLVATSSSAAQAAAIGIRVYSQRSSPSRASIGGSVQVGSRAPGRSEPSVPVAPSSPPGTGTSYTPSSGSADVVGNFRDVGRVPCATPTAVGTCYRVPGPAGRGPRGGGGGPPIDPQVLAQLAADRLALLPGSIDVSPSREVEGLTGAPSWFWLDPAPTTESVTIAQGPESVTVTAVPSSVEWAFGDGEKVDAGAGRPYGERAEGRGSVRHRYRTRCLPGDQGRDPYVLASCTPTGYAVEASIEWTISFEAVGPITTAGGLPPRTTATTIDYPVGEVRGFLTRGSAR